ncbi:hypothetical protein AGMMS50268_40530 [Spirochaetia bacterium]|nr:hypothetical protein AGMMS50268_40530 [Spirochaetia bacterium]
MDVFLECLKEYCLNGTSDRDNDKTIFNLWFRCYGEAYTFVYKQNLHVTNIQHVELLMLLKKFCNSVNNDALSFISSRDFLNRIEKILFNFVEKDEIDQARKDRLLSPVLENKLLHISTLYNDLFEHLIVVDPYYCTSAVFLPHNLTIDIEKICYFSGYIHSCGENIYTRNMLKASKEQFCNNLERFKEDIEKEEKYENMRLMLYTHEDFTPYDRSIGDPDDFLKNGLDNIKFYMEKYYMQKEPLWDVFEFIKNDSNLGTFYNVMPSGDYRRTEEYFTETSVWLIIDYSVGDSLQFPGDDKYYICYHQSHKNENPFHLFDENKPGWIDHVTIPHTLSGAMLNIAILLCGNKRPLTAIDPFVGTGTTYLEALRHNDLDFSGSDISGLSRIATKDNLRFFCIMQYDLKKLILFLVQILEKKDKNIFIPDSVHIEYVQNDVLDTIIIALDNNLQIMYDFVSDKDFNDIKEQDFISWTKMYADNILKESHQEKITIKRDKLLFATRILIYTMIKAHKRNAYAILRARKEWKEAFYYELKELYSRTIAFKKQYYRMNSNGRHLNSNDALIIYSAPFSKAVSLNPLYVFKKSMKLSEDTIEPECDISDRLNELISEGKKFDIILTDPPYGFNTDEDKMKFSQLYLEILPKLVEILSNNGIIMLCLPAHSHSGKGVDYFVQKEIISLQLNIAAIANNKVLHENIEINKANHKVYTTSLYWDSEKALKRDIVCFQFSGK